MILKLDFFSDLRTRIQRHVEQVQSAYLEMDDELLNRSPAPGEWSVLQCFEHLNLTHEYYAPKIEQALAAPAPGHHATDRYRPSFWGRIYMHFAFNPKYSFPTADEITPGAALSRNVLDVYLEKQQELLALLNRAESVDLRRTPVPIQAFVRFNLGDCLKILVYHDELHIGQAAGVVASLSGIPT